MKLFNVKVEASYFASYEGLIDTSYTVLVFANTSGDAVDFVNKGINDGVAKEAYEVDASLGLRKRKPMYYADALNSMTTYASQVCADKDREIKRLTEFYDIAGKANRKANAEINNLNESLTVMVRKNAELVKELEFKRLA